LEDFQKREKVEICKKLNYDPKINYLLYIGRLAKNKGIENILEVFIDISKKLKNIKLIIIGSGPLDVEIKRIIEKNHLKESIILKGQMNHDEICYYYNIASILINVGMSGGLPNVAIEAIASRLPVVATDVGASKDFVNENLGTGILVNTNDVKILESAILRILNDEKISSRFNQKILEKFSFDNFGKQLVEIYKDAEKNLSIAKQHKNNEK